MYDPPSSLLSPQYHKHLLFLPEPLGFSVAVACNFACMSPRLLRVHARAKLSGGIVHLRLPSRLMRAAHLIEPKEVPRSLLSPSPHLLVFLAKLFYIYSLVFILYSLIFDPMKRRPHDSFIAEGELRFLFQHPRELQNKGGHETNTQTRKRPDG